MTYNDLPTGTDLDELIGSYTLNTPEGQRCVDITYTLLDRIAAYETKGGAYGALMLHPHLIAISADGAAFLRRLGQNDTICSNFEIAYIISDVGKIHQSFDQIDWMAKDSTSSNPHEKKERRLHTLRGIDVLDEALAHESDAVRNHDHWRVVKSLMAYHHEFVNGEGEHKLPAGRMGQVLQVACIVDALDGDTRKRPHQEQGSTIEEALDRMTGLTQTAKEQEQGKPPKYADAFDPGLLAQYRAFKLDTPTACLSPPPRKTAALALL